MLPCLRDGVRTVAAVVTSVMRSPVAPAAMLFAAALLASPAGAVDRPNFNAYYHQRAPIVRTRALRASPPLAVASLDRFRQVPTFAFAGLPRPTAPSTVPRSAPAVARHFLDTRAQRYRVSAAAINSAAVQHVHDTGRGGIVVTFRQRIAGLEVIHNDCKVLLTRNLELVAIGGNLRPETSLPPGGFVVTAAAAVATAFTDTYGIVLPVTSLVGDRAAEGGYRELDLLPTAALLAEKLAFVTPARSKQVLFALPRTLVPAYYVEIDAGRTDQNSSDLYGYVIAADDGRVLFRKNLTQHETFSYRVFAEADGEHRPFDGPIADHTPHPTGIPDQSYPAFVPPVWVTIDGFNTNPENSFDPWLPAGATETKGNNVDAYTDDGSPQGFSAGDLRAAVTSPNTFDYIYDTAVDPLANDTQRMASVTQLFFVNNWLHDYWYDSGFDEAAGNAQLDNYGRGGLGSDPLLAEGQDSAPDNMNNANMSTPADGKSPRMQMYIYSAPTSRSLDVSPPNQSFPTGAASFGPQTFEVTASVVLVNDNAGNPNDACQTIVNDVAGKIALIDRGTCTFVSKVQRAEAAGALAVLIANNQPNQPPPQLGGDGNQPNIGALSITQEDGDTIKKELQNGPVTATLKAETGIRADGTIDNLIIAHEWGHYIHNRLVTCSSRQCGGQGEGWGDFLSLITAVREGDNLNGTFADAVYAGIARPDSGYYGIRRAPYSVDLSKNGFTFKHITSGQPLPNNFPQQQTSPNNAEVHNTGEIWASMLFEGYVGLLERSLGPNPPYSFSEARRRMTDYVVAGMKLAPTDPTFTEQRDALLAAATAVDFDDMFTIATGFAKRGAGSCAVSPPRDSFDNAGVVESFEVGAALKILSVTLDDSVTSCDGDGVLDAGETGLLTIDLINARPIELEEGSLTLSTTTPGVTIKGDEVLPIKVLAPFSASKLTVEVSVDPQMADPTPFELEIAVDAPGACQPNYTRPEAFRLNYDNVSEVATFDDFESGTSVWTPKGEEAEVVWSREQAAPLDTVWHGVDIGHISDTQLESPPLQISANESFVLTMEHRHSFEVDDEPTYWDGGVIEISKNGGLSWEDVALYDDPGYGGPLSNLAENPLSDQKAFAASNPSWPGTDEVVVDFGTAFAGETVLIRFRIGTDQAAADFGWEIHRLSFDGITNTPFPSIINDATACMMPPNADAGPDQTVNVGSTVSLDGSASSDPVGLGLAYAWKQLGSPTVDLLGPDSANPSFVAPDVEKDTALSFELTVTNSDQLTSTDTVVINVLAPAGPRSGRDRVPLLVGRGCGCALPGGNRFGSTGLSLATLLAALGLALRRRRIGNRS